MSSTDKPPPDSGSSSWASFSSRVTERARSTLNRLIDRIDQFEQQGGLGGAFQRGIDRVRVEQERIRREAIHGQGPLSYYARVRRAYARLETPYGADLKTVRTNYRRLMRRYHPDRHSDDPERERVATEIAQKLSSAYDLLCDHLKHQ